MIRSTLIAIVFLLSLSLSYGQEMKPALSIAEVSLDDENKYAERGVQSKLKSRLKKDFLISNNAFLSLSTYIIPGETKTINGMDSYTVATSQITYTIKGDNLPEDKITLDLKTKGNNKNDLYRKMGNSLIRNKKHVDELNEFIKAYMEKHISTCAQVSKLINDQLDENEIANAYSMMGYYEWLGNCKDEITKSEKAIEEKHTQYACDLVIQKSSILANSSNINDLNRAIDILYMVPPGAPCADEAINVSAKVSENAVKLNNSGGQKLSNRIVLINSNNQSEWKSWYRKNYTKIYRR